MSILTDEIFRKARRAGLSDESSVFAVAEHGRTQAGRDKTGTALVLDRVKAVFEDYLGMKARGLTHHEALDEILLAGFSGEL